MVKWLHFYGYQHWQWELTPHHGSETKITVHKQGDYVNSNKGPFSMFVTTQGIIAHTIGIKITI